VAAGVVGAIYILSAPRRSTKKPKPLHVPYDPPPTPLAFKIISWLPRRVRYQLGVKAGKPTPPSDAADVLGPEHAASVYETTELVPDKLWRVRFFSVAQRDMLDAFKNLFGDDFLDPAAIDRAPAHLRELIAKDQECVQRMLGMSEKELFEAGHLHSQNMLVARLAGGGLLLYNPARMHEPMVTWLKKIGGSKGVEWIVSGSSSHTNQVPQAAEAFPSAKILCARAANDKCVAVGMRHADFVYTDAQGLRAAQEELAAEGVAIHHVVGDNFTQGMVLLVHKHLLEVDLLYSNGERFISSDKADWEKPCVEGDEHRSFWRLFFYASIRKSPNGNLPTYRFFGMDPTNTFASALLLDPPLPDGSSCTDMALSLRELLKMDFDKVEMVHSERKGSIPAEEFRDAINKSWRWLDGKSLLDS